MLKYRSLVIRKTKKSKHLLWIVVVGLGDFWHCILPSLIKQGEESRSPVLADAFLAEAVRSRVLAPPTLAGSGPPPGPLRSPASTKF